MSFSFGFAGDDIEDDDADQQDQVSLTGKISSCTINDKDALQPQTLAPKRHSFEDLLSSLPSQISYNTLTVPNSPPTTESPSTQSGTIAIHRRSLFDIRAQLMAEANPETHDAADILLSGLENGDLSSGIYEGGFKTWECSLDLASSSLVTSLDLSQNWHIVELGAGSAVPSLSFLTVFLTGNDDHQGPPPPSRGTLKFTLCDYNEDVLRLCTAPNVFLNYRRHLQSVQRRLRTQEATPSSRDQRADAEDVCENEGGDGDGDGDLDIEALGETFITTTLDDLKSLNVSFDFISGGWGDAFLDLIPNSGTDASSENLLILASETIYSPATIKPFTETVVKLLRRYPAANAKAWVAAKKVYFGVGGGVDEFLSEAAKHHVKSTRILETKDTGVGRVVLEVTL
ncbi:hypothetical protein PV08_04151 [Exophiala spinifera]|uniref:protein-histidine N-methyltransferase n=1 Tax=Exophiala spinifera TaxID=91928 RepID=A0A0D2BEE8_9EURO|nr:uncharacterized protein PV08_04151 [Exophiala spinifera]KIW16960.1 hypothetical protein PV08_04151 [Exophiala spinifera]